MGNARRNDIPAVEMAEDGIVEELNQRIAELEAALDEVKKLPEMMDVFSRKKAEVTE